MFQTNGACEKSESIEKCAVREFFEESGNPSPGGVLADTIRNPDNRFSTVSVNKIGDDLASIASRMVEKKFLYFNMSSAYLNKEPVSSEDLQNELQGLNDKLSHFSPFYAEIVPLAFSKPPLDFGSKGVQTRAQDLIARFEKKVADVTNGQFLTPEIDQPLQAYKQASSDGKAIKEALLAIADVTEHSEVSLMRRSDMEKMKSKGEKLDGFFDAGFPILHDLLNEGPVAELFQRQVS
jgi:hypothetical protein